MNRFRCIFLFIFLLFIFGDINAQSDDITLIGKASPFFSLDNPIEEIVVTSENENLTIQIDEILVEDEQILVRFFVKNLSANWKDKICDDARLYGSYLPSAEILLEDGTILTPSSASKYSFLEFADQLIIGGLFVFITDKTPQTFYLNFNQIPFDTQPLYEGFSKAVILTSDIYARNQVQNFTSEEKNGLEFTLTAAAQTNDYSMLQPAVRMIRSDEILSKFGWISIIDKSSGIKYAVTRGNLYGFNLTDDSLYSPAHSYIFRSIHEQNPLEISMDHAYIVRSYNLAQRSVLDLNGNRQSVILQDEDFCLIVKKIKIIPEKDCIRIYIDSGEKIIADISFDFSNISSVMSPSVSCGIESETKLFACDMYFNDISFPTGSLRLEIDAIEYLLDGPWDLTWIPVPMSGDPETDNYETSPSFSYAYENPIKKTQPREVQSVLDNLELRKKELTSSSGWIHECYELDYQFDDNGYWDLIQVDQIENYFTHYISEFWYHIDDKSNIDEILTVIRDPENMKIQSAVLQRSGSSLDLVHALLAKTNQPLPASYQCFKIFYDIADSSAVFISEESCAEGDNNCKNLSFYQTLNDLPDSKNRQDINFVYNDETTFIESYTISYDLGALNLTNKTLALEKTDILPEDLIALMDFIK